MKNIYNLVPIIILFVCNEARSQIIDTLTNVGKHDLHFRITPGDGTPILFESGNGEDGGAWENILKPIHNATGATLITYDRAGLGRSEIDTNKISFKQEVKDLTNALTKLGFKNNCFLVAHSFGGMYSSEFARQTDNKIRGAVFIDVGTPCSLDREYTTRVKNSISGEIWEMLRQHRTGLYYVLQKFPEIAEYMSRRYISDSIPLTLIVAEHYKPTKQIGETKQDMQDWKECLYEFGNLSGHKYVIAKNTDHKVWDKDPDTVIEEITTLYLKVSD